MPPPSRRRDLDIARLAQQRNHHHPHHLPPPSSSSSSSSSRPHHHRPAVLFDPEYSLHECFLEFHGPAESPYAHGVWYLHLYLPADYPFSSPSIGFQNKILHPNIDEASGSICLDVINQTWTPLYSLENIVDCFVPQLLRYANPSDPLNPAAAALAVQRNTANAGSSASSSSSSGLREGYSEAFWSAVKAHMSQHATREAAERALPPRYRSVLQQQQQQQEMDHVSAAASSAVVGAMMVGASSSASVAPLSSSSTSPSSCGGSEVAPNRSTPTPLFVSDHQHQPKSSKTMMGTGVEESPSGLSAMDSSEEYEPEPLDV